MGKKVNYTDSMINTMTEMYGAAETEADRKAALESIAEAIGRSVPSVRTKLAQLGLYVKPSKVKGESAEDSLNKSEMVALIEPRLGLEEGAGKSLKFATKLVLQAIIDATEPEVVTSEDNEEEDGVDSES